MRGFAAALLVLSALVAGSAQASTAVGGGVVGGPAYDYSPSVITSTDGATQDVWWCGGRSASDPANYSDTIKHQRFSFVGGVHVTIPDHTVLGETVGAWDSVFTCNPSIVEGAFVNPLGDGVTYTYALYYVGTAESNGTDNSIGVAFSNDGDRWVKYPSPVIATGTSGGIYYGLGQPNASYADGTVTLLYESSGASSQTVYPSHMFGPGAHVNAASNVTHIEASSADGVHFTTVGALSPAGLPSPTPSWGGAAYDAADGLWYAAYNDPIRPPSTTGGMLERGQPGVTLYSTPDLLAGPWTEVDTLDTNLTGYESNFLAGLSLNPDGTLAPTGQGGVELYLSTSVPRPAANATPLTREQSQNFNHWDITWSAWAPGAPLRAFTRYYSSALGVHEVTTGWADTSSFHVESVLGDLYEAPQGQFTQPLYGCIQGSDDYFIALAASCEGQFEVGLDGYLSPTPGAGLVALYRCLTGGDHFVSTDPGCEGKTVEALLGYAQEAS